MTAKRKADLEAAEQKKKARKLRIAAEVKRSKQEAAVKKQQADLEYSSAVKRNFMERMQAQD